MVFVGFLMTFILFILVGVRLHEMEVDIKARIECLHPENNYTDTCVELLIGN